MHKYAKLLSKITEQLNVDEIQLSDGELREKELCEDSLYEFGKRAWKVVEGTDFIEGWHLEVISAHLEALYDLEISNLLINQPFRTGKSMFGAVIYPAWVWAQDPTESFLYTSYAQTFSVRDSIKCRRLIQSAWYQSLWGNKVKLRPDVQNKLNFEIQAGGYRLASSVDGSNTGGGANFIVCFPYETIIQTNKGELPIGRIVEERINCEILSYNHLTNLTEYKDILEYMKSPSQELIEIEICDGTLLRCTLDHPIYVEGKGYIRADQIQEGNVVRVL